MRIVSHPARPVAPSLDCRLHGKIKRAAVPVGDGDKIAQARHDLAHINAVIRLVEGGEQERAQYILSHGFFKKGEIADICLRHLKADGDLDTRQLISCASAAISAASAACLADLFTRRCDLS